MRDVGFPTVVMMRLSQASLAGIEAWVEPGKKNIKQKCNIAKHTQSLSVQTHLLLSLYLLYQSDLFDPHILTNLILNLISSFESTLCDQLTLLKLIQST